MEVCGVDFECDIKKRKERKKKKKVVQVLFYSRPWTGWDRRSRFCVRVYWSVWESTGHGKRQKPKLLLHNEGSVVETRCP